MIRLKNLLFLSIFFFQSFFLFGQIPFTCDGSFYVVRDNKLTELFVDWPNDTFWYAPFPNVVPDYLNAIGYNPVDNFIYGIRYQNDVNLLYQVDATGQAFLRDTIDIDYTIWSEIIGSGTFNSEGDYKVYLAAKGENYQYPVGLGTIDISTGIIDIKVLEVTSPISPSTLTADIAISPIDNQYYGIEYRALPFLHQGFLSIDESTLSINNSYPSFEENFIFTADSYFFDSFGTFYATGSGGYEIYEFDIINDTKRKIHIESNGITGIDGCSCPYTIKLNHTTTPTEAFPCTEVTYTFIFSNFSKNEQNNITFSDDLPVGFIVTEVLRNPYGGTVAGIGTDEFSITDMEVSFGIDSVQLTVLLPADVEGTFYNQAVIRDFDLTGTNDNAAGIVSNYPPTVEKRDSTPITIVPFEVDLTSDFFEICEDDTLQIAPFDNYPGLSFTWNTGSTDSVLTITQAGDYGITVFAGCNSASANFAVVESPLAVDLGADIEICFGDSINLEPIIEFLSPVIGYDWQISNSEFNRMACDTCSETFLKPLQNGAISLLIENEVGCFAETSLNFEVIKEVFAPNIFSPNNDGLNDVFYIQSKNDIPIRNFKIFDRWGSLLFEKSGGITNAYSDGWNGFSDGKILDAGVYLWFAEIEYTPGERAVFKGDIALIR